MDISTCSVEDYVRLNVSFLALTHDDFKCKHIEHLLGQRDDGDLQIEIEREKKGCGVIKDEAIFDIDGLYNFYSCACHDNFQFGWMDDLLFMYHHYKKGVMPYSGSLMDQPNQILEYFQILDGLYSDYEEAQAQKSNK